MAVKTVIIGGGAIGLSVAYHLGKRGVKDIVLLERNQLTSGTSWHAAGIVGPLRASQNLTELARYGIELFRDLEQETGQDTGYRQTGGLWLAQNPARLVELKRLAAMAAMHDLDATILSSQATAECLPALNTTDLAGALWVEQDGQINPVDLCMAYARGARQHGVEIRENARVVGLKKADSRITTVVLSNGEHFEVASVINCAGLWAREIGRLADVDVPLRAVEHIYLVSEPASALPTPFPIVRDLDSGIYIKGDAGKLVLGTFESNPKLWDPASADPEASYLTFDADWDHAEPMLNAGIHRLPRFESLGISQFMNGPESFTPDTRQIMGRAPGCPNFFVAAGFNSIGIMSSAGVGKAMADWVIDDRPSMDLWEVDIARFAPADNDSSFLDARIPESVHNQFQIHWPFKQYRTGRNRKRSPWHDHLERAGAVFGAPTGWERPLWFAREDEPDTMEYSYHQQSWWAPVAREARALMTTGAVFDLSPFGKFVIEGNDAAAQLDSLTTKRVTRNTDDVTYTLMLNPTGGIELECTVTRLGDTRFLIVSGAATRDRDLDWLARHMEGDYTIADVTEDLCVLGIMGPSADALLKELTDDFDPKTLGFSKSCNVTVNGLPVRLQRISYVGERGVELYVETCHATAILEYLHLLMPQHQVIHSGLFCIESCRLEKRYVHWGHDIGPDDDPVSAGLGFALDRNSDRDYIGKTAIEQLDVPKRRLSLLEIQHDPESPPLLLHDEPVYLNQQRVGRTTSGGLGFRTGKALSMAWLDAEAVNPDSQFSIDIAGQRYTATYLSKPPYP